jgi:hypothetical protein
MKHILRSIWEDIRVVRNIELYLSIFLALVVVTLNIFSDLPFVSQAVSSATLTILALVAYGLLQDRWKSTVYINISSDNKANMDYLCDYIIANKISKARLIQYSGDMVRRVVENLLERGVTVELLLQHPSKALNQVQIEKMASFQHRVENDIKNSQNLAIRYYKEPAAVKGVKFDDSLLSMGWYTYRNKSRTEIVPWLYGHNNAAICVNLGNPDTHDLVTTFDETFQALWENAEPHSDTIRATINQMLRQSARARKQ